MCIACHLYRTLHYHIHSLTSNIDGKNTTPSKRNSRSKKKLRERCHSVSCLGANMRSTAAARIITSTIVGSRWRSILMDIHSSKLAIQFAMEQARFWSETQQRREGAALWRSARSSSSRLPSMPQDGDNFFFTCLVRFQMHNNLMISSPPQQQ